MQTKNNYPKKKKRKRRILFWLLASLLIIFLLLIALTPTLISTKKGNQIVLDQINKYIDGSTDYSSLSMSWLKGISVKDLRFNNSSGQILLFIKQLSTRPYYLSLLTQTPSFGPTSVDEPRIEINLKTPEHKTTSEKNTSAPLLPVKQIDLTVNNGSLKVTDPRGQTAALSQINTKLNLKPPGQQTDFDIDMNLSADAEKSNVAANGRITPAKKTGWSLEDSTGNLSFECNDLDLETLGPLFALAGIDADAKGIASANLTAQFEDGRVENLTGFIKASNIDVTAGLLKGDRLQTKTLDINAKLARQENIINIENFDVNTDWLKAQMTGSLPTTFDSLDNLLKSSSELNANFECQIGKILSQMPNTFSVKKEATVTAGLLKGSLKTEASAGQKNITGQATLTGLAGIVDGKNIAISQPVAIDTQISSDNGITRFDKLNLSASFAQLNCSGTTKQIQYTAQSDLSKLQAELGQFVDFKGYNIAGNLSQQATVNFDKDKIAFAGSSQVQQLSVASDKAKAFESKADITFDMQYKPNEGILAINYLNTDASLGKINIKDSTIAIDKSKENSSKINLSAKTVDLEKARPFALFFTTLPKEMSLSGIADSDVSITVKNNIYQFKTDNTKINRLKITYPDRKDFEQDPVTLVADGSLNLNNKTVALKNWQLTSPEIKFGGQYEKNTDGTKGRANLEYNWAYASSMMSFFLPSELKIEGQRKDTISFDSQYPPDKPDQLWPNLNAAVTTGFDKAEYAGLTMGKVETNIKAKSGLLNIEPISTTLNSSKFDFAASADLKAKPVLLKTLQPVKIENLQINDLVANQLLVYMNPIFKNTFDVNGLLNFQCEKAAIPLSEGDPNNIEAVGSFSIEKLRFQIRGSSLLGQMLSLIGRTNVAQDCKVTCKKFVIKDGLVRYVSFDDMQIDIGDITVNFKGTIGLDKMLNMEVTLPVSVKNQITRITLPLTGTIDHPVLDTKKLPQVLLQNVIEDQLQDILKGKIKGKSDGQTEQKGDTDKPLEDALQKILIDQIGRIVDPNAIKRP